MPPCREWAAHPLTHAPKYHAGVVAQAWLLLLHRFKEIRSVGPKDEFGVHFDAESGVRPNFAVTMCEVKVRRLAHNPDSFGESAGVCVACRSCGCP